MSKQRTQIVGQIVELGVVAIIRMSDSNKLMRIMEALKKGGVSAIEITMSTPNALKVIEACRLEMGDDVLLGAGSILDAETARLAILAGAKYIVSPVTNPDVIAAAHGYEAPAFPGAFTPTEIQTAHEYGADIVKVFPADVVGMPFFRAVKAPLPHVLLMPTGGVTADNAGEWIKSGASVVGAGAALLDKQAIAAGRFEVLTENAKKLCESVANARAR